MRSHSSVNPGIFQVPDMCSKILGCFNLPLAFLCIREIDKPVGEHGTNTGFFNRPCSIFHEEVHIIERSSSAADHLNTGKTGPPVDIICLQVSFEWPDLLRKPVLQDHIVSISPQERHCSVRVGVYQSRECNRPVTIDDELCLSLVLYPLMFTNACDGSCIVNKNIDWFSIHCHIRDQEGIVLFKNICHGMLCHLVSPHLPDDLCYNLFSPCAVFTGRGKDMFV